MNKNLYITKSGTLSRKDNTLIFHNNVLSKVIPIEGIEAIYALGELEVNSKLLTFLQQKKVTLHFFNYYGYYSGSFYPRESYVAGQLFIKQVERYQNQERRIELAKKFVVAIADNANCLLRHYTKHGYKVSRFRKLITREKKKLNSQEDIKQILLREGNIWDLFYQSFKYFLLDDFILNKRVRRPPDNPINALISFGNSLVYTGVLSSIYFTQLNPTISYLHEPFERRFSLALDIAEVFKPLLTFQTIFKLVNKRMIKVEHFDHELNYCYLSETGRAIFVHEFDRKLRQAGKHPKLKRSISNLTLIKLECYKLIKYLIEGKEYTPYNRTYAKS